MEREFQIHRTEEDYALAEFYKWALAFLIGVAMGCIGFIVDWGIETLNDFKYYHTVSLIASRGASQNAVAFIVPYIVCVVPSGSQSIAENRFAPAYMTLSGQNRQNCSEAQTACVYHKGSPCVPSMHRAAEAALDKYGCGACRRVCGALSCVCWHQPAVCVSGWRTRIFC